jgi:hypothetical protein
MISPSSRRPFRLARCTGKDKSNIKRPLRFTCGTTANGEIFRLDGGLLLMESQVMMRENPASTWYATSSKTSFRASGVIALACGPFSIARSIASLVQSSPQSTGTPFSHLCNVGANGCRSIHAAGLIKLRFVLPSFRLWGTLGTKFVLALRLFFFLPFAISFGDWKWLVDPGGLCHPGRARFRSGTITGITLFFSPWLSRVELITLLTT